MKSHSSAGEKPARFFFAFALTLLTAALAPFGYSAWMELDHTLAIQGAHGPGWYRSFGGQTVPEIIDQDIFYHNIGASIDHARQADAIILGPSFSAFAIDPEILSKEARDVNFFNMSFIAVRGGMFHALIAEKYHLHPKLWIINVDSQVIPFFSDMLTTGAKKVSIPALSRTRLGAYAYVVGTSLKWRLEDWLNTAPPSKVRQDTLGIAPSSAFQPAIYRNVRNGVADFSARQSYKQANNPRIVVNPNASCIDSTAQIAAAHTILRKLGGEMVFILVPKSEMCTRQAKELSQALGVELLLTQRTDYSSWDGGGHIDEQGRIAYSHDLAALLRQSSTFNKIFPEKSAQP